MARYYYSGRTAVNPLPAAPPPPRVAGQGWAGGPGWIGQAGERSSGRTNRVRVAATPYPQLKYQTCNTIVTLLVQ